MPNDCDNYFQIWTESDSTELEKFITNELKYNDEKTGENLYVKTINFIEIGKKCMKFKMLSYWKPDFEWLENLLPKYPTLKIKNEWIEEGGYAGVWIGYTDDDSIPIINELTWIDMCIEAEHFDFQENKRIINC